MVGVVTSFSVMFNSKSMTCLQKCGKTPKVYFLIDCLEISFLGISLIFQCICEGLTLIHLDLPTLTCFIIVYHVNTDTPFILCRCVQSSKYLYHFRIVAAVAKHFSSRWPADYSHLYLKHTKPFQMEHHTLYDLYDLNNNGLVLLWSWLLHMLHNK